MSEAEFVQQEKASLLKEVEAIINKGYWPIDILSALNNLKQQIEAAESYIEMADATFALMEMKLSLQGG